MRRRGQNRGRKGERRKGEKREDERNRESVEYSGEGGKAKIWLTCSKERWKSGRRVNEQRKMEGGENTGREKYAKTGNREENRELDVTCARIKVKKMKKENGKEGNEIERVGRKKGVRKETFTS